MPNLYTSLLDRNFRGDELEGEDLSNELVGLGERDSCTLYEAIIWFGRIWSWPPNDVLRMPIRRRNLLLERLAEHVKKYPPMTG